EVRRQRLHSPSPPSFAFHFSADHRHLHSFPTRRSSDLTPERFGNFSRSVFAHSPSVMPTRVVNSSAMVMSKGGLSAGAAMICARSEEHTSELQSRENLVCRLLLEKKKKRMRAARQNAKE